MAMSTSVTISIPWEIARELTRQASRRGISPNKLAANLVKRGLAAMDARARGQGVGEERQEIISKEEDLE